MSETEVPLIIWSAMAAEFCESLSTDEQYEASAPEFTAETPEE